MSEIKVYSKVMNEIFYKCPSCQMKVDFKVYRKVKKISFFRREPIIYTTCSNCNAQWKLSFTISGKLRWAKLVRIGKYREGSKYLNEELNRKFWQNLISLEDRFCTICNRKLGKNHICKGNLNYYCNRCYSQLERNYSRAVELKRSSNPKKIEEAINLLLTNLSHFEHDKVETDPINNHLGDLYWKTENISTAIKYWQKAMPSPHATQSLAKAYRKLGKDWFRNEEYAKSLGFFKKIANLEDYSGKSPMTATDFKKLGDTYERLDFKGEAKSAWLEAAKLNPNTRGLKSRLKRVKEDIKTLRVEGDYVAGDKKDIKDSVIHRSNL